MVNFAVFNELSLPLNSYYYKDQLHKFFEVLTQLKQKKISKIRMNESFRNFEILNGVYLQQFIGQLEDRDLKARIMAFLANNIIALDSPLLLNEEFNNYDKDILAKYFFDDSDVSHGGLAYAYIFRTLAVSFATDNTWNQFCLSLNRDGCFVSIMHASDVGHLNNHTSFFNKQLSFLASNITRENFYSHRNEIFTNRIKLCEGLEEQVPKLNEFVFQKALRMLIEIDSGNKDITDFDISLEGDTVENNKNLRSLREFYINGEKKFFTKHVKGFHDGYRMYYFEINMEIYIGYLGKHLPTKNY